MKLKENSMFNRYFIIIKYLFSSGICFVSDQVLFNLFYMLFSNDIFIIPCKLIARAISSIMNYIMNSKVVFQKSNKSSIYKYFTLVVVQAIISSLLIYILKQVFSNAYIAIISICVDIVIFFVNYFIQKELIFK